MTNKESEHFSEHHDVSSEIAHDNELLLESFGGWRGMVEAAVPSLVYITAYGVTDHNLKTALITALVSALLLAGLRLVRGGSFNNVLGGIFGVGISSYITHRTGHAQTFFLPGILTNAAYLAACLISLLLRKPLFGFVFGAMTSDLSSWLNDPQKVQTYSALTWLWTIVFGIRLAITVPLYLAGHVTSLGLAKLILGWPLFLLAGYITYRLLHLNSAKVQ